MLVEPAGMRVAFFDRPVSPLALSVALIFSLCLAGCSHSEKSLTMDARAELWAPAERGTYLPVGDKPPPREQEAMTADEEAKLRSELTIARARQLAAVKTRNESSK